MPMLLKLALGAVGIGGIGGIACYILGPMVVLDYLRALGRFLAGLVKWIFELPKPVFVAAAGAFALLALLQAGEARHWKKQSAHDAQALVIEKTHEASIARQAVDLKTRVDALTSSITDTLKERADAEDARIAADAAALRLRGPGKATCASGPVAPATSVRPDDTASAANAAGPLLPSDGRAAVSWSWLVTRAQQFDQMRSKLQAVEDQHAQFEKAWPKGTTK